MRVIVDGDGCPDKDGIVSLSKRYDKDMYVFIDYAHVLESDDYHIVACDVGHDSVDMAILNFVETGDLVITQDYGLAGLLLSKKVIVLHVSGKVIDENNINTCLSTRYLHAQIRQAGQRIKGPSKRTVKDRQFFLEQVEKLLKKAQI